MANETVKLTAEDRVAAHEATAKKRVLTADEQLDLKRAKAAVSSKNSRKGLTVGTGFTKLAEKPEKTNEQKAFDGVLRALNVLGDSEDAKVLKAAEKVLTDALTLIKQAK